MRPQGSIRRAVWASFQAPQGRGQRRAEGPLSGGPPKAQNGTFLPFRGQFMVNWEGCMKGPFLTPSKAPYAWEYLHSDHWKAVRSRRKQWNIEYFHGLCEECLDNQAEECHHLHYDTLGEEQDYDLKMLCRGCHAIIHGMKGETKKERRERLKEKRYVESVLKEMG